LIIKGISTKKNKKQATEKVKAIKETMQRCLEYNPPSFINITDNTVFSLDPELCLSLFDSITMIKENFKFCIIKRFTKEVHQPIEVLYKGEYLIKPQLSDIICKEGLYSSGKHAQLRNFTINK
jgi:hypothetical protein